MVGAAPKSDANSLRASPACPPQLSRNGLQIFQFPSAQGSYHTYRPTRVPKKAIYVFHTNDAQLTTFPTPWDPASTMTMRGSFYKVFEDLSDPDKGFYGSTVAAMQETNICIEGDEWGEGVWVKKGTVSAVHVSGKQSEESGAGMCVQTWHDGVLETEVKLKPSDWVVRQDGSAKRELMVLGDDNFRKRYERVD